MTQGKGRNAKKQRLQQQRAPIMQQCHTRTTIWALRNQYCQRAGVHRQDCKMARNRKDVFSRQRGTTKNMGEKVVSMAARQGQRRNTKSQACGVTRPLALVHNIVEAGRPATFNTPGTSVAATYNTKIPVNRCGSLRRMVFAYWRLRWRRANGKLIQVLPGMGYEPRQSEASRPQRKPKRRVARTRCRYQGSVNFNNAGPCSSSSSADHTAG